jgi:hypothetical protein
MDGRRLPLLALLAALALPGSAGAAYAPHLTATVDPTTPGQPAALTTTVTQAANENASRTVKVQLPQGFGANLFSTVQPCGSQRPCPASSVLGNANAVTAVGPLSGSVNLTGIANGSFQLVVFLSGKALGILPINQTLTGTVAPTPAGFLTTFDNLPNVLTTSLTLRLDGPPRTLLTTPADCGPYTIAGDFTSQQGEHATSSATVTISGCPPKLTGFRLTPRHPRAGAALRLTYHLSAAAPLTLRLRQLAPRRRVLLTKHLSAAAGDGSIRLRGRRAGRYRVALGGGGAVTRRLTFRVR